MNVSLRTPLASDYAALRSWIADADECARWAGPKLRFPFVAQELPALLDMERLQSFSMESTGGVFLGFGQYLLKAERKLQLARVIVSPTDRGRGLGKTLVGLLIQEAMQTIQPEVITLRVYKDNRAALALYSGMGFAAIKGQPGAEVLIMENRVENLMLPPQRAGQRAGSQPAFPYH